MIVVNISVNDQPFGHCSKDCANLGPEELEWGVMNIRFYEKYFEEKYREKILTSSSPDRQRERPNRRPHSKTPEQKIETTAREIRDCKSTIHDWLQSTSILKQRFKSRHCLLEFFEQSIVSQVPKLDPVKTPSGYRNLLRNKVLLWQLYRSLGLQFAILVLYAFSLNDLDSFTWEETVHLFEFICVNRDSLTCNILESEADELQSHEKSHITWIRSEDHVPNSPSGFQILRASDERLSPDGDPSAWKRRRITSQAEINYAEKKVRSELEKISTKPYELLSLTGSLGGHTVPDVLFQRLGKEQNRWDATGEMYVLTTQDAFRACYHGGLSPSQVHNLGVQLSDYVACDPQHENSSSIISPFGKEIVQRLSGNGRDLELALRLVCFVFPRERLWEQHFEREVKSLLPILNHLLRQATQTEFSFPLDLMEEVLQCLLVKAALTVESSNDLQVAQRLYNSTPGLPRYLEAAIAYRQSLTARLNAQYELSNWHIDQFERSISSFPQRIPIDRRLCAWRSHMFVSRLKNLNMQEKFDEAHRELREHIIDSKSSMEMQVIIDHGLVASDIERSIGRFGPAKEYLQGCYECIISNAFLHPKRHRIVCALVDIKCALNEIVEADTLVSREIEILGKYSGLPKAHRRLLVSWLDVCIAKGNFEDTRAKITNLVEFYQTKQNLDISDQFLHVRTLIASARAYHSQQSYSDAIPEWEKVIELATRYSAFKNKGYTFAFSQLFIGHAQLKLAFQSIQTAREIFNHERDNHWIPVITLWLKSIREDIAIFFPDQ